MRLLTWEEQTIAKIRTARQELSRLETTIALLNAEIAALEKAAAVDKNVPVERRGGQKPKTRILEDIVRERGPLHVTDLAAEAEKRGVVFTGKKPKPYQVRDILFACKTFHNFGRNTWGLAKKLPET